VHVHVLRDPPPPGDDGDVIDTAAAVREAVRTAAARTLGLDTARPSASAGGAHVRSKRKSAPTREGPLWKYVTVILEHDISPKMKCNNCSTTSSKEFCGGATRFEQHICETCTCNTDAFLHLKQKILND